MSDNQQQQQRPELGVAVLVWNHKDQILLGKRRGKFGDGDWQNPGGRLELYETPEECAVRELREETGLTLKKGAKPIQGAYVNCMSKEQGLHCVTLFMHVAAGDWEGQPQTMEPDKCEGWQWFCRYDLPEPLFISLRQISKDRCLYCPNGP